VTGGFVAFSQLFGVSDSFTRARPYPAGCKKNKAQPGLGFCLFSYSAEEPQL
jgi:hypothetical protein